MYVDLVNYVYRQCVQRTIRPDVVVSVQCALLHAGSDTEGKLSLWLILLHRCHSVQSAGMVLHHSG